MAARPQNLHHMRAWRCISPALTLLLTACATTTPTWHVVTDTAKPAKAAEMERATQAPSASATLGAPGAVTAAAAVVSAGQPSALPDDSPARQAAESLALLPEPGVDDLWSRMRRSFKLPALRHALVDEHLNRLRRTRYFHQRADRVRLLLPLVVAEVERQGLPMELALIPLVESALNCQATSPASAHGCWQFMPVTAKDHALVISALVDQRRDLLRSTRAGLGYLSALQQQTGDWFLAMGAYNWGIGRVLRLRDRALAKGASADFLALMQGMPSETRNYVPQVEALKRLILEAQPDELPDADATPGLNPVPLTQDIDVVLAARLSGVSASDLLRMNPAVHGPLILAAAVPELLLPAEAAERLRVGMQTHVGPMSSWQLMRMDRARTVIDIARMRGVPAQMIREVNRIPVGMKPAAGSTLLLPSDANGGTGRISPVEVEAARRGFVPEVVPVWLNARRQDTLATIARRLQLSTAQLVSWNPTLTKSGRLRPGQRVKVLVAPTNSRGVEVEMRRDLR